MSTRRNVQIPDELHRLFKLEAADRHTTVGRLLCEAGLTYVMRKRKPSVDDLGRFYVGLLERWDRRRTG